jgi:hypothetical protein
MWKVVKSNPALQGIDARKPYITIILASFIRSKTRLRVLRQQRNRG